MDAAEADRNALSPGAKTPLTNRERILRTLACEPVDRPPFPWTFAFMPWGQTLDRWRDESGIADLNPDHLIEMFSLEPFCRLVPIELGPWPPFEPRVLEESPEFIVSTDSRGITVRNRRDHGSMPEFVRHPVANRSDWIRYREERLQPLFEHRLAPVDSFVEQTKELDAPVQVGHFPWGIFGTYRDLLGAEECLLLFYDDPQLVEEIMTALANLWLCLFERVREKVRIDHIHIWEDMCGKQGSLISMDMVERFMMPHYDRIADFARNAGVRIVSVDSDGNVEVLLRTLVRHGINAFLPFEVQAGNDIERTREEHPGLGILGGLDKTALARGGADLRSELRKAERMMERGGYVPGFDHLIPPDVPWKHYRAAMQELRRMVGLQ